MTLLDHATEYLRRGWMPVPLPKGTKFPVLDGWEKLRLTEAELPAHFGNGSNIGLILGEPSGALVDADLDCDEAIELGPQYLPTTPAKTGRPSAVDSHWWYYAEVTKTSQFRDPVTKKMIVELRSTGGQTVVGPSIHPEGEQYSVLTGEPTRVPGPMLEACVEALYQAVIRERYPNGVPKPKKKTTTTTGPRPQSADVLERRAIAYLDKTPPAISGQGGHSQTYAAAVALVHGFCLSPDHALQLLLSQYNPRCQPPWTEKELLHKVEDAATKPHDKPYGWLRNSDPDPPPEANDVDISALMPPAGKKRSSDDGPADPGPMPDHLLAVPGFIEQVVDFTLATSPYPQHVMAFCGALSLQALLGGRKVRDPADNRTPLYVLGLANSGVGKNRPRFVNQQVLLAAGLHGAFAETFASGEAIEDALYAQPSILFQTDEIDGLITAIHKGRDVRYEGMMNVLLRLFTSVNGIYSLRVKAGKEARFIDQPCMCVLGTAIPDNYYEALSMKMLTNGFFARMVVIEAGRRGNGQDTNENAKVPEPIAEIARWWAKFQPGSGNLDPLHPTPRVVPYSPEGEEALRAYRDQADAKYVKAEDNEDQTGMAIWARANEKARRLALVYACSENHQNPIITADAANWASHFVDHQTRRMLYMAVGHVAENEFHAECLKALRKLREAPDKTLPHSTLLKRMKMDAKKFRELTGTLIESRQVVKEEVSTQGRTGLVYRLIGG